MCLPLLLRVLEDVMIYLLYICNGKKTIGKGMSGNEYYKKVWEATKKLGWSTAQMQEFLRLHHNRRPEIILKKLEDEKNNRRK